MNVDIIILLLLFSILNLIQALSSHQEAKTIEAVDVLCRRQCLNGEFL